MFILAVLLLINLYILFISINLTNPLFMAACLLASATLTAMHLSLFLSSWFFYFIILVFLGGVMVVVLFMCSICVNKKMILMSRINKGQNIFFMTLLLALPEYFLSPSINTNSMMSKTIMINLYQYQSGPTLVILAWILLVAMVAIVSVSNMHQGPLR